MDLELEWVPEPSWQNTRWFFQWLQVGYVCLRIADIADIASLSL